MPSVTMWATRPSSLGWLLGGVLSLLLPGCLVPRVDYHAEIARGRALEHDLELSETRGDEIGLQVRHLERRGQNLALERSSLDEERIKLLNELEEMHSGNLALQEELLREREIRQTREAEINEISGTYRSLVEELEQEVQQGHIEIHRLRGRLQVRALDQILFDSGRTEIKTEGRRVLAHVAEQIRKIRNHRVRVEGHTDSKPINTARFPSNWELSAARAARVVRFLAAQGLDPSKLSAEGFGPYEPIAPNDTRKGRARNRRIEIVLVPEDEE